MAEFVIIKQKKKYKQLGDVYPKVRISQEAYATLVEWAKMTDRKLSDLCSDAVMFAAENCKIVEE